MVCEKCEAKYKLKQSADPNKLYINSARPIGENKLLTASKARFNPTTANFGRCLLCKTQVHQVRVRYCQPCAFKRSICAICGKKLMDIRSYKQSTV